MCEPNGGNKHTAWPLRTGDVTAICYSIVNLVRSGPKVNFSLQLIIKGLSKKGCFHKEKKEKNQLIGVHDAFTAPPQII